MKEMISKNGEGASSPETQRQEDLSFLKEQTWKLLRWYENPESDLRDIDYSKEQTLPSEDEKNKHRITWFGGIFGIVDSLLEDDRFGTPEEKEIIKTKIEPLRAQLRANPREVTPEMVNDGDNVLHAVLDFLETQEN